jgi:hypothetical protein
MKRFIATIILVFMLTAQCMGAIVTIDLVWGFSPNYNIQEGSIVQVVAYRTGQGSNPSGGAANNFDEMGGISWRTHIRCIFHPSQS